MTVVNLEKVPIGKTKDFCPRGLEYLDTIFCGHVDSEDGERKLIIVVNGTGYLVGESEASLEISGMILKAYQLAFPEDGKNEVKH